MKCMFTGTEIDELKAFDPRDEFGRMKHAEELSKWEQVTVSILRDGQPKHLLVGMVSPGVRIEPGDVSLVLNKETK